MQQLAEQSPACHWLKSVHGPWKARDVLPLRLAAFPSAFLRPLPLIYFIVTRENSPSCGGIHFIPLPYIERERERQATPFHRPIHCGCWSAQKLLRSLNTKRPLELQLLNSISPHLCIARSLFADQIAYSLPSTSTASSTSIPFSSTVLCDFQFRRQIATSTARQKDLDYLSPGIHSPSETRKHNSLSRYHLQSFRRNRQHIKPYHSRFHLE